MLNDNGHHFEPFEEDIQNIDIIDCGDSDMVNSGTCGKIEHLENVNALTTKEVFEITKKIKRKHDNKKYREYIFKNEIIKYLSKYHIDIMHDENGFEYLMIKENSFNITIYPEEGIFLI